VKISIFTRNLPAGRYPDFLVETGYGGLASIRNKAQMDSGYAIDIDPIDRRHAPFTNSRWSYGKPFLSAF